MSKYIVPLEYLSFDPRPYYDLFNSKGRLNYNPNWSEPGDPAGHEGNDLYNILNFYIRAARTGWCTASGWLNGGAGYGVEIYSPDDTGPMAWSDREGTDGEGHRYLHMPSDGPLPKVGDWVHQGDVIGRIGMSGATRSPHLHWGTGLIKSYNPRTFIINQWLSYPPESTGYLDKKEEPEPTPEGQELYWPTLIKGDGYQKQLDLKEYVQRMQYMLALDGYIDTGPVNFPGMRPDGAFGPSTKEALILFQVDNDLPADGVCDMDDWIILFGALS